MTSPAMRAAQKLNNYMLASDPDFTKEFAAIIAAEYKPMRQIVEDLLPYAQASIGLPESSWSPDNVILRARAILAESET